MVEDLRSIGAPMWITIAVIVAPMLLTFSKAAGNLPGALGALSRWWQNRQTRAVERSSDLDSKLIERAKELDKTIEDEVKRRVDVELAPILERIKKMEARLQDAETEVALRDEYILLQARNWRNIEEWAAANGHELPPPPAPPRFTQWVIEQKHRHRE